MNVQERIDSLRKNLEEETARVNKNIAFLEAHRERLEKVSCGVSAVIGNIIDFDNPTREQVLEILRTFPARWDKTLNSSYVDPKVNYEGDFDGHRLRIWAADPPPSCKIEQYEVVVPTHTETRQRLVCKEAEPMQSAPEPATETQPEPASV